MTATMTALPPESSASNHGEQYLSQESRETITGSIRTEIDGLVRSEPAEHSISGAGMEKDKYDIYETPMDSFRFSAVKYVDRSTGATIYETSALREGGPMHDPNRYAEIFRLDDKGRIQLVIDDERDGISVRSDDGDQFQGRWLTRMQRMLADRQADIKMWRAAEQDRANEIAPVDPAESRGFASGVLGLFGLKRKR